MIEAELSHEEINQVFEVIPLENSEEWRQVLSYFKEQGRNIVKGGMDTWSVHDSKDVLVNVGAAPCVILITDLGDQIGQGHYVQGNGSYDKYLDWIDAQQESGPRKEYIFGQSFPSRGESKSQTFQDRHAVDEDLRNIANLSDDEIFDYREQDENVNAADHIIVDGTEKRIYLLRINKN